MSVIVCRQKRAGHPYFLEELGVNIYTCQELCYGIYHHPILFMDGIMNQNLVDFIRDEFGMGFVAARLEQRMKSGDKPEELLFLFMQPSGASSGRLLLYESLTFFIVRMRTIFRACTC